MCGIPRIPKGIDKDRVQDSNDGISDIISAYSSHIQFFGEFLRNNDQKRDQFLQFFLTVVLSAIGFSVVTLVDKIDLQKPSVDLSMPIYKIIAFILLIVLLIGLLTFNVMLRYRIMHTLYLKIINRNRGFLIQAIYSRYPKYGEKVIQAWREHIHDDWPPYLTPGGVEHNIMLTVALINGLLFGGFGALLFTKIISTDFHLVEIWAAVGLFGLLAILLFWIQKAWMEHILRMQDKKYIPYIREKDLWNFVTSFDKKGYSE